MLKYFTLSLLIFCGFLLGSCKVNRIRDGLKTGLRISRDDGDGFKNRGRYWKGRERGVWKYYYNDTLYQKEKYSGNNARVRLYHRNKRLSASGRTQIDFNGKLAHWYYQGDWKYYDTGGKLLKTVTYEKGSPVAEIPSAKVAAKTTTSKPVTNKANN